MTGGRLASGVLAGALMRRAQAEGGFAALLAKGDADSGAILVILAERGEKVRILERALGVDGRYSWLETGNRVLGNPEELEKFLRRRCENDPDLWVLELDIASAERFAAEMNDSV